MILRVTCISGFRDKWMYAAADAAREIGDGVAVNRGEYNCQ